jgi:hypothetical protein
VKVVALLSWYDEPTSWLSACIASCAKFCDHVVAVDGAYLHFPGGKGNSATDQAEVITETAAAAGMGVTIHRPNELWYGGEVEKRAFMFAVAETLTTEDDWYFPIDADELVDVAADDLRDVLGKSKFDCGDIKLFTRVDLNVQQANAGHFDRTSHSQRQVFRALRGLTVKDAHFNYIAGNKCLWGSRQESGEDLTSILEVEHRDGNRPRARREKKEQYYKRRDALGIECWD